MQADPTTESSIVWRPDAAMVQQANLTRFMQAQGVVMEPATRCVTLDGASVMLSAREFDLLQVLMLRPGQVLSREQIEQHLYGWGQEVDSNAVEVHIHNLRRKLGSGLIQTVRGVGYTLRRDAPA